MPRLTKITTKTGDDGTTSLGSGARIEKDSLRIEATGAVDELNSQIGAAIVAVQHPDLLAQLATIQNDLFHLGADLCLQEEEKAARPSPRIEPRHVKALEKRIDAVNRNLHPLDNFILPGGSSGAAQLHLARAVCRRAERSVIRLSRAEKVGAFVIPYLNRLSDALFVMARFENLRQGKPDVLWDSRA
jgi:cob(I)alamin adenosyltransferase